MKISKLMKCLKANYVKIFTAIAVNVRKLINMKKESEAVHAAAQAIMNSGESKNVLELMAERCTNVFSIEDIDEL